MWKLVNDIYLEYENGEKIFLGTVTNDSLEIFLQILAQKYDTDSFEIKNYYRRIKDVE